MARKLIFDHAKWIKENPNFPNFLGKKVRGKNIWYENNVAGEMFESSYVSYDQDEIIEFTVEAQWGNKFIAQEPVHGVIDKWYPISNFHVIDKNGGVLRRLLTHVCQAVASSRKEVAVW